MKAFSILFVCLLLVVSAVFATDDGRVDKYSNGLRVGSSSGSTIKSITATTAAFAGDTSKAVTVTGARPGNSYMAAVGWLSASADPGKTTYAITTNTITVTVTNATTGTMSLIVVGK